MTNKKLLEIIKSYAEYGEHPDGDTFYFYVCTYTGCCDIHRSDDNGKPVLRVKLIPEIKDCVIDDIDQYRRGCDDSRERAIKFIKKLERLCVDLRREVKQAEKVRAN